MESKKIFKNKSKTINKMAIQTFILIITLCKWIKCSNQKYRLAVQIQKQDTHICCLQDTHFRSMDIQKQKVRGWEKLFHANGNQKKAGVTIHILDKIDFKINMSQETEKDTT